MFFDVYGRNKNYDAGELADLVIPLGMVSPSNAKSHVRSIGITAISTKKKKKKLTRLYIKL